MKDQRQPSERSEELSRSEELPVLRSDSHRHAQSDAPWTSEQGFLRQLGRVWIRRAMLLCAVCAIALAAAVPLLLLLRVQGVYAVGASHYDEQAILDMAGIAVGDELLSTAPDETEQRLLRNMPYLATVSVERTLRGQVTIVVTERTPLFALEMGDGQVALLDEHMRVLELGQRDVIGMSLCQVAFELFPRDDEQTMTPGDTYRGNPTAVGKVSAILEAALSLCPETPPVRLDMNDPYNVQLTLSDGTVIALHECTSPQRQLRTAMDAIETYRDFHGHVDETLRVDVDDFFRVSLRPLPPAGQ
ncbi:MAG: FtsQ-type POTRA domain-containing protein [Ruminococcaceae bacterium]|nr:FtsQ-type POTRA domain-containing protein [Oscillospiraceae bacterium]